MPVNVDSAINMSASRYVSAERAATLLGVRKATLYAYVSRGRIRSRAVAGTRKREYLRSDIERLRAGKRARQNPREAARASLRTEGLPVLQSALSCIEGGRVFVRGRDLVALADTHTFEDVAELLWGARLDEVAPARPRRGGSAMPLLARLQARLSELDARDPAARSLNVASGRRIGAAIVRSLTAEVCGSTPSVEPVAQQLARAWALPSADALDAALVLCTDHGLNVSAFTARCVASAGASLPMVVTAALAALSGRNHGGHAQRVAAMLDSSGSIARIVARVVERDGELPGFGHPLYPDGDPRATALLKRAAAGPAKRRSARFANLAHAQLGLHPNLDLGLVTLCRSIGAPSWAPWALFALGRCAGWVAHALEQYGSNTLIRPRAEYIGPPV
jgi:citrate synthase